MKMRRNWLFVVVSLFLLVLAGPAAAQEPVNLRIDAVDSSQFPAVTVAVTMRNDAGGPIANLATANFDVSEDRTLQSRPIIAVEPVVNPDVPVTVVMAVDVSGSMTGVKLRDAQEAARRFLDSLGAQDRAALLAFAGTVDLDAVDAAKEVPVSADKAALYAVVDRLVAGGATPLYDTATKAVRWAAAEPAGNRAVLLFSDGREERDLLGLGGSQIANDDTAIREANKAGIPVFTIGLGADADEGYLRRLALETGGVYQAAADSAELAQLFQNVSDLLKQQVRVTYQSGVPADGGEHSVLVLITVDEQEAFDESPFGPVPLLVEPTATAMPTDTPAPTATPIPAMPTAQPVASTADASADKSAVAAADPPELEAAGLLSIPPAGWGALLALLLLTGALGVLFARRRQTAPASEYLCLRCGAELPAKNAQCPSCGYLQSFRDDVE